MRDASEVKTLKKAREIITNLDQADADNQATIQAMESEINKLKRFRNYFSDLYGHGYEVANWHQNGDLEALDSFIDSANDEMEASD